MSKLTGAALDRAAANALGLKSVNNCEKWSKAMTEEDDDTQVYKKPWVELTDEEIDAIYWQHENHYGEYKVSIWPYERAIEAKLKEKNT